MTQPRIAILVGDALGVLRAMPAETIDCCVTSPPYWGLRDYGVAGAMGSEPTLAEHIEAMVALFREIGRVLKPSGTVWLNYGDVYASKPNGRSAAQSKAAGADDRTHRDKPFSTVGPRLNPDQRDERRRGQKSTLQGAAPYHVPTKVAAGGYAKPKDLLMIPNRLAIALQDDGWFVRSEIIWGKTNPKPDSARDRPGVAHEKIFMLTKSPRYFYNAEAGRVAAGSGANSQSRPAAWDAAPGYHGTVHRKGRAPEPLYAAQDPAKTSRGLRNYEPAPLEVWRMATAPYRGDHYATFPPELARRCIEIGCPPGGTVLDPFGGSCTTGIVAQGLGRPSVMIELSPAAVEDARRRIRDTGGACLVAIAQ